MNCDSLSILSTGTDQLLWRSTYMKCHFMIKTCYSMRIHICEYRYITMHAGHETLKWYGLTYTTASHECEEGGSDYTSWFRDDGISPSPRIVLVLTIYGYRIDIAAGFIQFWRHHNVYRAFFEKLSPHRRPIDHGDGNMNNNVKTSFCACHSWL
jgi:hypothetical protein